MKTYKNLQRHTIDIARDGDRVKRCRNSTSILTIPLSALVNVILDLDTPRGIQVLDHRPSSQFLHVVAREGTEVTGPLTGADVPSVVALLHHVYRVVLLQLQLVVVLRLVIVQRSISVEEQRAIAITSFRRVSEISLK